MIKTRGNVAFSRVFLFPILIFAALLNGCHATHTANTHKPSSAYQTSLMTFSADNLKQFSLVLTPHRPAPKNGYAVVIFGHGFHPEPQNYGISNTTGKDSRPGDYYRGLPESYAKLGYLVFAPDYRGHNKSEGFEFTQRASQAPMFYASDVLNLLDLILAQPQVDPQRIFYVGHSMGVNVGLHVLASTDRIRAASLWSSATDGMPDTIKTPLIIHHALGDETAPYSRSELLVMKLKQLGTHYRFFTYDASDHLFKDDNFDLAIKRDDEFFNGY